MNAPVSFSVIQRCQATPRTLRVALGLTCRATLNNSPIAAPLPVPFFFLFKNHPIKVGLTHQKAHLLLECVRLAEVSEKPAPTKPSPLPPITPQRPLLPRGAVPLSL